MTLYMEFSGSTDSRALYKDLKEYDVNVTDCGNVVYAYRGDLNANEIARILALTDKYDRLSVDTEKD